MSEHTLRPIWTPEDARQAARDAAKHTAHRGAATTDPHHTTSKQANA